MAEVEAAIASPKEEEVQDEEDDDQEVYSDPNGNFRFVFVLFQFLMENFI
jgi:hypothetical protein